MTNRVAFWGYRAFYSGLSRLRRRFTNAGLAVLGGMVVAAMLGLDTEQSFAYQSFALLFCLLAVSSCYRFFFRAHLLMERCLPQFASVDQSFTYTVRVRNGTRRPQKGLVLFERLETRPFDLAEYKAMRRQAGRARSFVFVEAAVRLRPAVVRPALIPSLLPNEGCEVQVQLQPLCRGRLRFERILIGRSDPLGLCWAHWQMPLPQGLLVLPRRYPVPQLALPGRVKHQQGGVALASSVGESQEFVFLRDYRRGDPKRFVHWRSWAKAGKPIVKQFQNEYFVRHALILDTFLGPDDEEIFEESISVAASFACAVESQESLLDLMFVGPEAYCFTTGRGLGGLEQILEILASVTVCRDRPFRALRDLVMEHAGVLSGCICVLQVWDQERQELVARLRALALPVLVLVVTRPGVALDPGPVQDHAQQPHQLKLGRVAEGLAALGAYAVLEPQLRESAD